MARFDERIVNGIGVLAAIVDSGSFAAAGEILGMSPSGVSRAVARLEARLGIRLFDRTTRAIALTDEGRRFHAQVMPLLAGLEDAITTTAAGRSAVRGRLRVNLDPYFSRLVLGPKLGAFLDAHPQLRLELITSDQLGDLVGGGFDLAIRFGHPRSSSLVARRLAAPRMRTVASPAYLEMHGRPLQPRQIERDGHVCILFRDSETGRPFPWEFHKGRRVVTFDPAATLVLNDAGTLFSVCLAGHGIAQVFDLGVQPMIDDGRLVDLFPEWNDERFPLHAYHPSRQHVPEKTRAFLAFVDGLLAS